MTNPHFLHPRIPTILTDILIALDKGREAFIPRKNSEKILCALSNNIRTRGDAKYYTRDKMYYKRANDRQWKGPASVLGQDG